MRSNTTLQPIRIVFLVACLALGTVCIAFYNTIAYSSQDFPAASSRTPQVEEILRSSQDPFCAYDGGVIEGNIVGFPPSKEIEKVLSEVSSFGPRPKVSFRLLSSNVANAAALVTKGQALILVNQQFMDRVKEDSKTGFSIKAILAHEVAHHVYGHTLSSTPASSRRNEELQADFFSGMVLQQMGATLDEALAAVTQIDFHTGSTTHPPKEVRKTAIVSGFKRPEELNAIHKGVAKQHGVSTNSSVYKKLSLKDNQGEYYVDSDDNILEVEPEGKVLMLGHGLQVQGDHRSKYNIGEKTYTVDQNGSIWKDFHGMPVKQGQVQAITIK